MDMTLNSCCWDCGPSLEVYGIATMLFFFAPIGTFVLRKHIDSAVGPWKLAGRALQALALLSAPFALLLVASVVLQML